jgi:hypothetical protein
MERIKLLSRESGTTLEEYYTKERDYYGKTETSNHVYRTSVPA